MKRKPYTFVEINLFYLEEADIVTVSAGAYDSQQENDLTSDDIFD